MFVTCTLRVDEGWWRSYSRGMHTEETYLHMLHCDYTCLVRYGHLKTI